MSLALGVHRWTFPGCTILEAAAIARALGGTFLDLGNAFDHDPQQVARDPERAAEVLRGPLAELGMPVRDAFVHVEPKFSTNHPDEAVHAAHLATLRGYLAFGAALGLHGLTLSPGVVWPGETRRAALERAAERLTAFMEAAAASGLSLRIEPHVGSVAATPEATLELLDRVEGLSLTLDYAHFIALGLQPWELDPLRPHATHWHLRQARLGAGQARFDEGTLDVAGLVRWWTESGYRGGVCLEYVHSPWMDLGGVDCVTETVRMRDEVRRLLDDLTASADAASTHP